MNNVGYCLSLIWNGILFLALNDDFGDISFIKENISTSLAVSSGTNFYKHDKNIEFSILALEYFLEYEYGQLLRLFGLVIMLKMDFLKLSCFNQSQSFLVYGHN